MAWSEKSYFKVLQRFRADYSTGLITKYESSRTGMQVLVVDAKGPKVHGFFTLATEIHDNSGAPHTLEHLIFMGSKKYTYKGVLDKLAMRAYAVTNAETSTEYTGYLLDTAGWEGFAQILPVYLDHILEPTLTDSGCYTEVHHVDGSGNDAGVVYSEMQGVQNTASEIMDQKIRQLVYPQQVGFRYETGGMMQPLRELTADRIREFHRQMYRPRNLCVMIVGEVDQTNLLSVLDKFEDGISGSLTDPNQSWTRPWSSSAQTPPLEKTVVEKVEFPEEDESTGEIVVAFLGPDSNDRMQMTALDVLLVYLAGSSVSVLQNVLVEREQLASDVQYDTDERPNTLIRLTLSGVATENLAAVEKKLLQLLKRTASNPLDMDYLFDCIRRQKRQIRLQVENSPDSVLSDLITDFLFGERNGTGLSELATLGRYDDLLSWSEKDWHKFLDRWISSAAHVSVLGIPSSTLSEKLKAVEKTRVEERKARLGPVGLLELEKKLAEAKAKNDVDLPTDFLGNFPIPSPDSIHFLKTNTARGGLARALGNLNNPAQDIINKDQSDLPLFFHFEDVETAFVHINLVISTGDVSNHLKPLLPVYLESFFNTPIRRGDNVIPFEKVVAELEKDTSSYSIGSGEKLRNSEVLRVDLRVEPDKYRKAVQWLTELLWDSIFDVERINATLARILASIPEEKRDGEAMVHAVDNMVNYNLESIQRAQNVLVKASYLKGIRALLQEEPETVLSRFEELRNAIGQAENFRLLVIADLRKLETPVAAWKLFAERCTSGRPLKPLGSAAGHLSHAGRHPGGTAYLVPLSTIDSSYSVHTTKGPGYPTHPQIPALIVAIAYLDTPEGPMWQAIRGAGLAYGAYFQKRIEPGHLVFSIYSSPAASKAFIAGKKVIEDLISGATPFEPAALDGAISNIIYEFADEESSMVLAARASLINQVILGVPKEYNSHLLKQIRQVTVNDLKAVLRGIVLPAFQPENSNLVVTCATTESARVKEEFEEQGFKVEIRSLTSFQDDYGIEARHTEEESGSSENDSSND